MGAQNQGKGAECIRKARGVKGFRNDRWYSCELSIEVNAQWAEERASGQSGISKGQRALDEERIGDFGKLRIE